MYAIHGTRYQYRTKYCEDAEIGRFHGEMDGKFLLWVTDLNELVPTDADLILVDKKDALEMDS